LAAVSMLVRACSGPITTAQSPLETALCGGSAAGTKTAESCGAEALFDVVGRPWARRFVLGQNDESRTCPAPGDFMSGRRHRSAVPHTRRTIPPTRQWRSQADAHPRSVARRRRSSPRRCWPDRHRQMGRIRQIAASPSPSLTRGLRGERRGAVRLPARGRFPPALASRVPSLGP
jgi:hypothetical protein